jgi:hypothetical protein
MEDVKLFDKDSFVAKLKVAGMDEKLAETLADNYLSMFERVTTKTDMMDLSESFLEQADIINTMDARLKRVERLTWGIFIGVVALVLDAYFFN